MDFETNYQKLLAAIKAQAAAPQPSVWWLIAGRADIDRDATERQRTYCEDVAILSSQLVYMDLASIGIEPNLARLVVLSRLLADNAPISHLREELSIAIADVIASRAITNEPATTKAPVMLFTGRMQPITGTDIHEHSAAEAAPSVATDGFDRDRWREAMAHQLWGTA
jgi:hypothetical protein